MRLLLDTHIWVWNLLDPSKLSRRAARAIADADSQLWLSPISVWEFLIMVERGRIRVQGDAGAWIDQAFAKAPIREAPLTHEIVRASRRLAFAHQDPADRFIAATAQVLDLVLVTADEELLRTKGLRVLAGR